MPPCTVHNKFRLRSDPSNPQLPPTKPSWRFNFTPSDETQNECKTKRRARRTTHTLFPHCSYDGWPSDYLPISYQAPLSGIQLLRCIRHPAGLLDLQKAVSRRTFEWELYVCSRVTYIYHWTVQYNFIVVFS